MKNKAMHIQLKISDPLFQRICAGMKEISAQQRNPFTDENRVLQLYAANPMLEPREIGELFTNRYGALHNGKRLNGDGVIRMLRLCRLTNPKERTEVLTAADQAATVLLHALAGSKQAQAQLPFSHKHPNFKRLVLLSLLRHSNQLSHSPAADCMLRMNKDFSTEALDFIVDQLTPAQPEAPSADAAQEEIAALRASLSRTQKLLANLQDSFETQLEESRQQAEEDFISQLNAAEYGYILDQMAAASQGFQRMRRNHVRVPVEIRSMQTLVRRLHEFVEDCGITPMMESGICLDVTAEQAAGYQYEGSPFANSKETKRVEIISPGWEIKEKDMILAQPRIREVHKEENT